MELRAMLVQALHDQNPGMLRDLQRNNQLESWIQAKGQEAKSLLEGLLADAPKHPGSGEPMDPMARLLAEEQVRSQILDFPVPLSKQHPEPPMDLPTLR